MAEKIGEYMKEEKIKFVRPCIPSKVGTFCAKNGKGAKHVGAQRWRIYY